MCYIGICTVGVSDRECTLPTFPARSEYAAKSVYSAQFALRNGLLLHRIAAQIEQWNGNTATGVRVHFMLINPCGECLTHIRAKTWTAQTYVRARARPSPLKYDDIMLMPGPLEYTLHIVFVGGMGVWW